MVIALLLSGAAALPVHTCGLARTDAVALDPLYGAAAASDGGRAFAFGGQGPSKLSSTLLVFEGASARPMPRAVRGATARRYHAMVARAPWLYVVGGEAAGGVPPTERIHMDTLQVEALAPLPLPRPFVSAAWHDGKIYVAGGETKQFRTARVDVYDADANTWSEGPALAEARDARLVDVDGTLYAIGGYLGKNTASAMLERLAPAASTWERAADLPVPTSAHAAVALGGKVYLLGDYTELGRALVYDVASNKWATSPSSFTPRRHAAATTVGGAVLLVGGNVRAKGAGTPLIESFAPACAKVAHAAPMTTCQALRDQAGADVAALEQVRVLCGVVVDLDARLAEHALVAGDRPGALGHLTRALTSASTSPRAQLLLSKLTRAGLSADELAMLAALGRDPLRPLYVPTVRDEYRWLNSFACPPGAKARRSRQGLRKDELDVLEVECDGKGAGSLYFDFATLPAQARP